jgi:hypothetical protein
MKVLKPGRKEVGLERLEHFERIQPCARKKERLLRITKPDLIVAAFQKRLQFLVARD